jgi:predicted DNA-binding transcriptional regulator YafY
MSTISRDIEFMRDQLGAPIEYDALHRGYYYEQKTYRLPAGFTTGQEMLALGMAKNLLDLYKDTPIFEAATHLFESIVAPLNAGKNPQWYEDRLIVPPFPSSPIPLAIWDTVTSALQENRIITFDYTGVYDDEAQQRRVRPYQLLFDTGVWHLWGFSEERGAMRLFSLLRMTNVVLTDDTFKLPDDFDFRARVDGSNFGVFVTEEKRHFRIAFYAESALWVRERQWATDQVIEETDDGIIVDFTSSQWGKVLEWVLSQGCRARPLEPQELVEEWEGHVREMGEMIEGRN